VHVDAEGAAVDLADTQVDELLQALVDAVAGREGKLGSALTALGARA
jgi:hypothetical protein